MLGNWDAGGLNNLSKVTQLESRRTSIQTEGSLCSRFVSFPLHELPLGSDFSGGNSRIIQPTSDSRLRGTESNLSTVCAVGMLWPWVGPFLVKG